MTPLLWDPFYNSMGATVAGGLIGATILVLLVVPLFYILFFRITPRALNWRGVTGNLTQRHRKTHR